MERVGEDGCAICTFESASAVVSTEVEQFKGMVGYKDLAEEQREWSRKDREDFVELHWVTDPKPRRKSTGGKRNPSADLRRSSRH